MQRGEVMKHDFKILSNINLLHEKAVQLTQQYLKAESDLISVLQKIDDCRGYRELGFKSLYDYATQSLKLSESVTYNLITVARKSKEVPKLQEMIQNREISISNARTIAPVLNFENQETWLTAAAALSKRDLEKEIAKQVPHAVVQERARPVARDRIELKLGISEKLHEKLKHVQDLVSSQSQKAATLEETLEALVDLFIDKKDPLEKAKRAERRIGRHSEVRAENRAQKRQAEKTVSNDAPLTQLRQPTLEGVSRPISPVPGQVKWMKMMEQANPRYIPAQIEHLVRLRDGGQCTQKNPKGIRCSEKRWLDLHHIQLVSQGGKTTAENLALLCRGHHQTHHHTR